MLSKHSFISTLALLLCLSGSVRASLDVFACEPEWASLANEIGGERLRIFTATTYMQDPHHIQARPSLIARTRSADLLICTGAELEIGWLPLLLRKAGNEKLQPGKPGHFMAAEHVPLLDKPATVDRGLGDIHAMGNPHVHTGPTLIPVIADALLSRLTEIDPDGERVYRQRHADFESRWQRDLVKWSARIRPLHARTIVVHHDYWSYLIDWAGLEKAATLEPVPGVEPGSSHLASVLDAIEGCDVMWIVSTSYVNDRATSWLSSKTGIPVITLPATVNHQDGETLQQWFNGIIDAIAGAP